MQNWKYTNPTNNVANCVNADGSCQSMLVSAMSPDVVATILPADPVVPQPDGVGFEQAIKNGVGGILAANALAVVYPLFFAAVEKGNWPDVQTLILDAKAKAVLSAAQYAQFQTSAAQFNTKMVLP